MTREDPSAQSDGPAGPAAAPALQDDASRGGSGQPDAAPAPPRGAGPPWLRAWLALPVTLLAVNLVALAALLPFLLGPALRGDEVAVGLRVQFAALAAGYVPAIALVGWAWRHVDQAPLRALGYVASAPRIARGLLGGLALGTAVMGVIVGLGVLGGAYTLAAEPLLPALAQQLFWVPVLLIAAHFEELVLRGYVLQNLARRRLGVGLGISSVLFALLHAANPNIAQLGAGGVLLILLNITLSGLWLGTAYVRSGDLWLPTGLHLGWNWAQGMVFGLPVSGMEFPAFARGSIVDAGGYLHGGAFGPESSLVGTVLLLLLTAEGLWSVRRHRRATPLLEHFRHEAGWGMAPPPEPPLHGGS